MCLYGFYKYTKCPHDTKVHEVSRCEFQAEIIRLLAQGIDVTDEGIHALEFECDKITDFEMLGNTYGACDKCLIEMLKDRAEEVAK